MKLMWFHLMPYTELPDDFRQKHPSVWVDIHSSLFDPKRAHLMYNDFMDELEYAAECGFDAICVNEHHSNGYGLMPSPNLIATALARRTTDTMLCVMGNSLALYNPPTRVAEEFAMIDCISGGRLIAGFPVGADGHLLRLRAESFDAARALSGSARPGDASVDREGNLRLQWPL
jgi:alkanesulfonate monooxygenase SsuD/methylene tetrahydromethanopterin reductase-like flavin-dependent oxidoreductase (luciferase family)